MGIKKASHETICVVSQRPCVVTLCVPDYNFNMRGNYLDCSIECQYSLCVHDRHLNRVKRPLPH